MSQNHHPYRQLTVSMLASGEAPLWNPLRGAGQPLLANPNALVLHPTTLLFLVLPFEAAFKLSIIGQIFLAGLGAWLVLRDIGAGRGGSLLGSAVFCFSGFILSLGNLINLLDSAAFMPLTLWLAGRAMTRGFAPWGSLAALALAVQLMAGEPAILICTAVALLGLHWSFAPANGPAMQPGAMRRRVAILAGVVLLSLALSMLALLPATELLVRSERGAGFDRDEALKWSLPPVALLETVVPHLFGDPTSADAAAYRGGRVFDAGLPLILSLYLGPGALLLAGVGLAAGLKQGGSRRGEAAALGLLAAGGAAMALGRFLPLYPALLWMLKPLESVRYPVKYFLIVTWAASLLSARGYDSLASRAGSGRKRPLLFGLLAGIGVAAGVICIGRTLMLQSPGTGGLAISLLRSASIVTAMLGLIGLMGISRGRAVRLGLLAVPLVDLLAAGALLNPVAPASFYSEPPLVERLLDQAGGEGRVWATPRPKGFAFRTPASDNSDSLVWGFRWDRMTLRNATYFDEDLRFAYDRGNERLDVMPGAAIGRALAETEGHPMRPDARSRLLSLAGVDRAITYGGFEAPGFTEAARLEGQSNISVVVMKNAGAISRVNVVTQAEVIPDLGVALRRLDDPSFDPGRMVILEEPIEPRWEPTAAGASASILADTPGRVVVSVTSGGGIVVLADTFYPGWRASIDGVEGPIIRADAMFRAVAVPAGTHEVEFTYRPTSVRSGLMVTAASLLLAALLAVPRRR